MIQLWLMYGTAVIVLVVIAVIGLRGAFKVRKEITKLARPEEEEKEEGV